VLSQVSMCIVNMHCAAVQSCSARVSVQMPWLCGGGVSVVYKEGAAHR
jgi:hypothetical protein